MRSATTGVVEGLRARTDEMVEALAALVGAESPTSDAAALSECASVLAGLGRGILGKDPEVEDLALHPALSWSWGNSTEVLLIGHFDTVWPTGTIDRWPFSVERDVATGPGCFDMKAGIVQGMFALASLETRDGVTLLLTSDEETGTNHSRKLIEDSARGAQAVLVLEPSSGDDLKIARKGVSSYRFGVTGKAAHAGLDPASGANALIELAHLVLDIARISRGETTVTPTVASAGTAVNVVPASANLDVDVRAASAAEQERVGSELRAIAAHVDGVTFRCEQTSDRPPLEREASKYLFARAQRIALELGLEPLGGVEVGGGSDGNYTAAVGTPTLDGLGAVGGGAHAEGEHVIVSKMAERSALVAALVRELFEDSTGGDG